MTRYAGDVDGPERRPKNLDEGKELVCQTAFGLAHLHRTSKKKECYIAGDIKPKNILTRMKNGKREYVLADLDDAHVVGKKAHISTPLYVCPADKAIKSMLDTAIKSAQSKKEKAALEQERGKLEQAADVYALGLSFRSIFTGEDPSEFLTAGKVSNKLGRTNPVPFEKLSDQSSSSDASEIKDYRIIYALIDQMTDEDWKLRPTGDMILQMLSDADFPVPDYGTTKR
jgi:serine/threonine protein kinase